MFRKMNWRRGGCLGGIISLVIFVLFSICCVGSMFFVFGQARQSDVYLQTMELVRQDEEVIAALGEPIDDGWLMSFSINYSGGGAGTAELNIPVSGPNGSGRVHADAYLRNGRWLYDGLYLESDGQIIQIDRE